MSPAPIHWTKFHTILATLGLPLLLTACGGGDSTTATSSVSRWAMPADGEVDAGSAASGPLPSPSATGASLAETQEGFQSVGTRKSVAHRVPVYRLYNKQTTAHFYTISETEKNTLISTQATTYSYDGPAFNASSEYAPGLSPVYRFLNTQTGVHFYTINEAEKNNILASLPQFKLEGTAYHASLQSGYGFTPLYRFYVPAKGFHFYTASTAERNQLQSTQSATYQYEGVAYHVPDGLWNADKLPHTGITASQCYGINQSTSADTFGTCTIPPLLSASPQGRQQDALRTTRNPMTHQQYAHRVGGVLVFEPVTSCVVDAVTGLIWEGKMPSGQRAGTNTYTGFNTSADTDVGGYVAAVNASALCGFTDWRVPSVMELASLANYGQTADAPTIQANWFPNTATDVGYWASDRRGTVTYSFRFERFNLRDELGTPSDVRHVRLVRGTMGSSGPRYTYTTVPYGGDAANNVANDMVTGLQWRRCLEGQTWTGSACTGNQLTFTHRSALYYADIGGRYEAGWRVPSAKEAHSLIDRQKATVFRLDSASFPDVYQSTAWTSTPLASDPINRAYFINFTEGLVWAAGRSANFFPLRLVR